MDCVTLIIVKMKYVFSFYYICGLNAVKVLNVSNTRAICINAVRFSLVSAPMQFFPTCNIRFRSTSPDPS